MMNRIGQCGFVSNEVENNVARWYIRQSIGVDRIMGADLHRGREFVVGDVDRRDLGVGQQSEIIDGVLTKPTCSDHGCSSV